MLYSGRGSDHLDTVPNAVKEWKNKRESKQGLNIGYYSSMEPYGRNRRIHMHSSIQSQ